MVVNWEKLKREKQYIQQLVGQINKEIKVDVNEKNIYKTSTKLMVKEESLISLLDAGEYAYVAIEDNNLDFNQVNVEKAYKLSGGLKYEINFKGELVGNKNVELYMVCYNSRGEKIANYPKVGVNIIEEVVFDIETCYVRFFIRLAGDCMLKQASIYTCLKETAMVTQQEIACTIATDTIEYVDDIQTEEYQLQEILNLRQIPKHLLYTEDDKISIEENISTKGMKNASYISLYEKNIHFGKLPIENKIEIDSEYAYTVTFCGEVGVGLKAQLFVLFYSANQKKEVYQVATNQTQMLNPSIDIKWMRLAIRIEGEGTLDIQGIHIQRQKKIGFIGYKNVKKLGFDTPKQLNELRMACIFDEFTTECYKYTCELMPITPYDWKAQFTVKRPHLLMVESAWIGNNGEWARKVVYTNENNIKELRELIEWCKKEGIPTVFWNKEDPVHYDVFINTAKMFDYIFTTDENKVSDYKRDTKNDNVYALPFAAQPKIHNPIKIDKKRDNRACFAGSYYASKYPERQEDINRLLDAAVETTGIEIYDRHFGTVDKDFLFPERFRGYIKGSLKPTQLHIANKGYKVMINVNSVKESPTMFSRRVFEGLACGTPVVSSYSEGINHIFEDLVVASDDFQILRDELNRLTTDNEYYIEKQLLGIRSILREHTYQKRLEKILECIGISFSCTIKSVDVVVEVNNLEEVDKAKQVYNSQTYKNKKLILLINKETNFSDVINNDITEKVIFVNKDYYEVNQINLGKYITGDYIAVLKLEDEYRSEYLEDLMLSINYTEAEVIGKSCYINNAKQVINEENEYIYIDKLGYERSIIAREVALEYTYEELKVLLDGKNTVLSNRGYRLFSIDRYNYIKNERQ